MKVWLASKSPRRKEILTALGVDFSVVAAEADETCDIAAPDALVRELSRRKAAAVGDVPDETLVIGCDTVVCLNDKIMGKPKDRAEACRMLSALSGNSHTVYSGLTLRYGGHIYTDFAATQVHFAKLSAEEIAAYAATGEPDDKAGAYAIQGRGAQFITGIEGCYYNVVGLPVALLREMTKTHGIPLF